MSELSLDTFVPTLDKLRAAGASVTTRAWWRLGRRVDLLTREPDHSDRLAALVVVAEAPMKLRYAYVPNMRFALEEKLSRKLEPRTDPPECLRADIRKAADLGPYRGGPAREPEFHGFRYGDSLAQVRTMLEGNGLSVDRLPDTVRVFAWPILVAGWKTLFKRVDVAFVVTPEREMYIAM